MFNKVLIADRGDSATRIIEACHELKITTAAIYSEADIGASHVKLADESYCMEPASASYSNMEAILKAAIIADVDAIHPGYDFLSGNDEFAALCAQFNIQFIGPTVSALQKIGIKDTARKIMKDAGIPVVPGSEALIENNSEALNVASDIGFPVILKATAGVGDEGTHVAYNAEELQDCLRKAKLEAIKAFGNPGVYMEKYIKHMNNIEIQVLADTHGHVMSIEERDHTVQQSHGFSAEKVKPISKDQTQQIVKAAIQATRAVNYTGVGAIHFIYDHKNSQFYFIDMSTRIPVKHSFNELMTDVELIKQQFNISAGKKLVFRS